MAFKTFKGKVAERTTPGALQLLNGEEVRNKAKPKENSLFSCWSLFFPTSVVVFFLSPTAKNE